jgi:hypothetical protein
MSPSSVVSTAGSSRATSARDGEPIGRRGPGGRAGRAGNWSGLRAPSRPACCAPRQSGTGPSRSSSAGGRSRGPSAAGARWSRDCRPAVSPFGVSSESRAMVHELTRRVSPARQASGTESRFAPCVLAAHAAARGRDDFHLLLFWLQHTHGTHARLQHPSPVAPPPYVCVVHYQQVRPHQQMADRSWERPFLPVLIQAGKDQGPTRNERSKL